MFDEDFVNFNDNHPELKEGEVFVTNSPNYGVEVYFSTKRVGKQAYNIYGSTDGMKGLVPVFAHKEEYDRFVAGIDGT